MLCSRLRPSCDGYTVVGAGTKSVPSPAGPGILAALDVDFRLVSRCDVGASVDALCVTCEPPPGTELTYANFTFSGDRLDALLRPMLRERRPRQRPRWQLGW